MWNHSRLRTWRIDGRIGSAPCSSSHLSTSKKKYCLLHSIPASACRITLAASSPTRVGVIARADRSGEFVGFAPALFDGLIKIAEGILRRSVAEPKPDH